jgi:anti-sigma factor RsiW
MSNFEERYTAWLDGKLDDAERAKFEAGLPDREAALADAAQWRALGGLMREMIAPMPVPHADFLNSQVLAAIRSETPAGDASRPARSWFPIGRLAWTGVFLAAVAAVLCWLWAPRDGGVPSEAKFISQVIDARSTDPKLGAYAFAVPGGKGAVLWVDDAGFIPATERLK